MPKTNGLGRGEIVTDFVRGSDKSEDYCEGLLAKNYNTFNFVSVEMG
jgi:uncharacterized protein with NRDE domain